MNTKIRPLKDYLTDSTWKKLLTPEFDTAYMKSLEQELTKEYRDKIIYPQASDIFTALNLTAFDKIKVVIIGQDPYHGPNQAHGLCFSVQPQIKIPPSLANIFKELESDLSVKAPANGHLIKWAEEGVLLLNSILTVEDGKPMAHKKLGWEPFTDHIIDLINTKKENIVFMLWGSPAHKKAANVDATKHKILKSVHPSPLSSYRGFFGCKHFSKCNEYLKSKGIAPINWGLN